MINLYDILKAANGQLFGEPAANLFTEFCTDPQHASENKLYVAIASDRGDTHQYIEEAIHNGVSGVLCTDPPEIDTTGVSVLMVRDTVDALLQWSKYTLSKLNVKTIAVTGSSGKSTTVDTVTRILGQRYEVHRGNINVDGRLNIPLSLASLTPNHDFVALKLDPTTPGEMAQMVEAISPQVVIVNHIDCVHPAGFASCKQYISEIAQVVDFLSPGSLAVLNYDDDNTRELASRARDEVHVRTIGIDRFGADALAFNVKVGIERIGFDLRHNDDRYYGRWSPILGRHQLYELLSGLMVGIHHDIPMEDALKSLTTLSPLPGRLSLLAARNDMTLVDDTYRASHASTTAALDWLADVRDESQRTIFVMGNMDDLGVNSRFGHRSIGKRAAEVADIIITQGVEASLISRAAIDAGKAPSNVRTTYSTQDACRALESFTLTDKDIVLVKGGVSARMEEVVKALLANPDDRTRLVRQNEAVPSTRAVHALRPSWVDVDAAAIGDNVRTLKTLIGDEVALMATVKADGYGHGAVVTARTALLNGASYLCVASMAEALELRDAGISAPILVLSYAPMEAVHQALRHNITVSVYDLEQARMYDRTARMLSGKLKYHVKVDTGMGRLGIFPDQAVTVFRNLQALSNLELEGIYTHFTSANDDPAYTAEQVETFKRMLRPLRAGGFEFRYVHAANSPGILDSPDNHFNMVRPGLLIYGLQTDESQPLPDGMRPALSWKTSVLQVKHFPPNHPIGYGRMYYTQTYEDIAILPVGYADGLRRSPQTWQYALIHGQRAPLVGRVSMEKCAVNVTNILGVKTGDEVVLLGQQGDERISAGMVGEWLGTINYEVVTTIIPRISRR